VPTYQDVSKADHPLHGILIRDCIVNTKKRGGKMRKGLIFLFCVVFALVSFSGAYAKTKWDVHLNYPAGNFHSKGAQEFADRVKAATNGELEIVLHPGSALGFKGPELLRAVAEGQLTMAEVPTGMVEGDAPTLALTAQPFISTNAFEQRLLYQLAKPTYAKILKKFNQFTLYTSVWPFSGIYTQRAVKSKADLNGLKMRVYDGTGLAFGKATGIAARKMPFSEVYPAMKAGLLDSMYTSSVSGVDAKAWEVLKYFTPINIVGPVNMINVNIDAWNKLPKNIQNTVLEIAAQMEDEMWNLAGDMDRKSRAKLKENGMTINPVDQQFRSELDAVGEKLRGEWAQKAGTDAQKILEEYYRITGRK
jgi:TRAP-type C4-dicarboxylate transport system substrate-binding protein